MLRVFSRFQFHKVRLKDIEFCEYKQAKMFQFHKVRLKASGHQQPPGTPPVSIP